MPRPQGAHVSSPKGSEILQTTRESQKCPRMLGNVVLASRKLLRRRVTRLRADSGAGELGSPIQGSAPWALPVAETRVRIGASGRRHGRALEAVE